MDAIIEKIYQGVLTGEREIVVEAVQEAIDARVTAEKVLKEGMMAAMEGQTEGTLTTKRKNPMNHNHTLLCGKGLVKNLSTL
ncbi:MAG: hypothetical protein FJZ98_04675 [Chloroflexi bacterium]|nr:hypothetical protein [Chloroflexota bacterium]